MTTTKRSGKAPRELTMEETSVHQHLLKLGIETPLRVGAVGDYGAIETSFAEIMMRLKLDLKDDSLKRTPARVAKMYVEEMFYGLDYSKFPTISTFENKMRYDEMIASTCKVHSCCEHHFVPFIGVCHLAYIPNTKVIGLSKLNRIVDFFSHRPQIQERLTAQISATLQFVLKTQDVAVVIRAEHFCVKLRGIKDELSSTTTSKMSGRFLSVPELRTEFLALTRK